MSIRDRANRARWSREQREAARRAWVEHAEVANAATVLANAREMVRWFESDPSTSPHALKMARRLLEIAQDNAARLGVPEAVSASTDQAKAGATT